MSSKNFDFSKLKLSNIAKKFENKKLDLVVDLDYLGYINVESKYLQLATIPWLISEIKLLEIDKKVESVYLEINVKKNSLYVYKLHKSTKQQYTDQEQEEILNHKLTDIFKLTYLTTDKYCFAYFYRQKNSFNYNLYAFYSNKSNLAQVIYDFQIQALRTHESLKYEKVFDFKLVTKVNFNISKLLVFS
jgi:hypothetical protein